MKTKKTISKFVILTLLMTVGYFTQLKAQNAPAFTVMRPVQAGTVTLVNGKATVLLDAMVAQSLERKQGAAEYYVTITPYSGCGTVQIDKKNGDSFSVIEVSSTSANNSPHTFEYVVFLKTSVNPAVMNKTSTTGN